MCCHGFWDSWYAAHSMNLITNFIIIRLPMVLWPHPYGSVATPLWFCGHTPMVLWPHPYGSVATPLWFCGHTLWFCGHTPMVLWPHPYGSVATPLWFCGHTPIVLWPHPYRATYRAMATPLSCYGHTPMVLVICCPYLVKVCRREGRGGAYYRKGRRRGRSIL